MYVSLCSYQITKFCCFMIGQIFSCTPINGLPYRIVITERRGGTYLPAGGGGQHVRVLTEDRSWFTLWSTPTHTWPPSHQRTTPSRYLRSCIGYHMTYAMNDVMKCVPNACLSSNILPCLLPKMECNVTIILQLGYGTYEQYLPGYVINAWFMRGLILT